MGNNNSCGCGDQKTFADREKVARMLSQLPQSPNGEMPSNVQIEQWKRLNDQTRDIWFWQKYWDMAERLAPFFDLESEYSEWTLGRYMYQGMLSR